jgi:integrase
LIRKYWSIHAHDKASIVALMGQQSVELAIRLDFADRRRLELMAQRDRKRALVRFHDRPGLVFRSLRNTVATVLHEGGVPEVEAAALLGHEMPTMSYGLYSGGLSLAKLRKGDRADQAPRA